MIELIISTLAEFGLIRKDFKHHKKITKKEKEDGLKRPFQRYFLQPSTLIVIGTLVIGSICAILFFSYQKAYIFPERTEKEISEMSNRLENWNKNLGEYPTELQELIGNSPIRQDWEKDAWNRPYKYSINKNEKRFLIVSAGYDGKFGTEDDIKSE